VVSGAHGVQHLVEAKVTTLLADSLVSVTDVHQCGQSIEVNKDSM
jgi:hypothetical protein